MTRELNDYERIALAITASMHNDIQPFTEVMEHLHQHYTLAEIHQMFTYVGAFIFNEGEVVEDDQEEEMKLNSGELIQRAINEERERIIKLLLETPEGLNVMLNTINQLDNGAELTALIKGDKND